MVAMSCTAWLTSTAFRREARGEQPVATVQLQPQESIRTMVLVFECSFSVININARIHIPYIRIYGDGCIQRVLHSEARFKSGGFMRTW